MINEATLGRFIDARLRQMIQRALNGPKIVSAGMVTTEGIAAGDTINLSNVTSDIVLITGVGVIQGINELPAGEVRRIRFDVAGGFLLNNDTSFILPNRYLINWEADDIAEFLSLGSGNWFCFRYTRAGIAPSETASFPINAKMATTAALAAYTLPNPATAPYQIQFTANGNQIVDGAATADGDAVLVKDETGGNAKYNGLYEVMSPGDASSAASWRRHNDMMQDRHFANAKVFVTSGTVNASTLWVCTNTDDFDATPTVGTTAITFANAIPKGWSDPLTVPHGGTGLTTVAQGDLLYGSATDTITALAKNTTATRYLSNTGSSNNPAWAQVSLTTGVTGTLPTGNGGTGVTSLGNITKTDDTNVTLTLGGTPTGAVITSTSFTLSWTGTLAAARLNSNVVQSVLNDTNVTGSISAQVMTLAWSGTLAMSRLGTFTGLSADDPAPADEIPYYDTSSTANKKATVAKVLGQSASSLCEGRLTLTSGTSVTTANVTGATNIYFTLFNGDRITIFDGTRLLLYSFTELTLALGTLVNAMAYDVFIYDNAGTLTLESLEWHNATVTMTTASPCVVTWTAHGMVTGNSVTFTNSGGALPTGLSANTQYFITKIDANTFKVSTTRANVAAATFVNTTVNGSGTQTAHDPQQRNTALVAQNGAWYKTGALTRRYLGSFFTTATTTTEDSTTNRFLWNYCNRVQRLMNVGDTTNSWAYTLATWRQANAADANRVNFLIGLSEDLVDVYAYGIADNGSSGSAFSTGIGIDATNANSALTFGVAANAEKPCAPAIGRYLGYPGIGYHAAVWLEISLASGTTTWYGDNGVTYIQSGMIATILG